MKTITGTLAAIAVVTAIYGLPSQASADDLLQNGNFWLTRSSASHIDYILGFLEGAQLGRNFAVWKWDVSSKDGELKITSALDSYSTEAQKYLSNVTVGQIADGLNQFYSDFRNRNIMIHDAVWLVLEQISGIPDSQLNLEAWRKNSRQ
ncbi:hypothetical protein [Paraburkholderia sp. BL10I2N1]|uniref:hypothetical protein n=1 Tax=Paraburkholderia sp. BL10I2N1 TaxID=1938796 RepID=UPI00105BFF22|nr:hypothetical protein [Paraburkholderia sp. BL10I2N1]TDN69096.1 hypothetical protein B0G77_2465 [Paraburkholderia sp. BL10I2N1]